MRKFWVQNVAQYHLGSPTPAAAAIPARVRCAHKTQLSSGSRFLIQKILNQKVSFMSF
jgi:hypothetical protein